MDIMKKLLTFSMKYCILPDGHQDARPRLSNEGSPKLAATSRGTGLSGRVKISSEEEEASGTGFGGSSTINSSLTSGSPSHLIADTLSNLTVVEFILVTKLLSFSTTGQMLLLS